MAEYDAALHNKVNALQNSTRQLSVSVDKVASQVVQVDQGQKQTQQDLRALHASFVAFVQEAKRTASLQSSQTQIGIVEARIEQQFGHHKVVRRSAVGMLQGFDSGLVSEDTVRTISEKLMIESPRYWLAPALVALAAWAGDDQALCARAVEVAFQRQPARTALFFTLVLRRQGRRDSSLRWLRHYLDEQDPSALSREFAVILESISQGAFGPSGRQLLQHKLASWKQVLENDEQATKAQVQRWWAELETMGKPVAPSGYPLLAKVSPEWPKLAVALGAARSHRALLDKYTAIMDIEPVPSQRLEDAVDDILDRLVNDDDVDELPQRRELAYHQAVLDNLGDTDAAQRAVAVDSASLDETWDYLTVQSTAALNPAAIGASPATQRLSVAACQEWLGQAHAGFTRDYRQALPGKVTAKLSSDVIAGKSKFTLPPWTGSLGSDQDGLERSLASHWDRRIDPFVNSLEFPLHKKLIAPGIVVLLILVVLMGASPGWAIVLALVVGSVWGLVLKGQVDAAKQVQNEVRNLLNNHKRESIKQLRGASAELTDWERHYAAAESAEPEARQFIGSLATAGQFQAPFEGRTVENEGRMSAS